MKTLNMFNLVIYWTQKVHNDFIYLYSIILIWLTLVYEGESNENLKYV